MLHEDAATVGDTLKHHNVHVRHVESLVEDVHGTHHLDLAVVELRKSEVALVGSHTMRPRTGVNRFGYSEAQCIDAISHPDRVIDRSAENNAPRVPHGGPRPLQFQYNGVVPLLDEKRTIDRFRG